MLISWQTLNPMSLVRQMGAFAKYFDLGAFEEYMKRVRNLIFKFSSNIIKCFAGVCLFFLGKFFLGLENTVRRSCFSGI